MVSACISFAAFARSRPTKHGVTNPGFPPHGWQHSASLSLSLSRLVKGKVSRFVVEGWLPFNIRSSKSQFYVPAAAVARISRCVLRYFRSLIAFQSHCHPKTESENNQAGLVEGKGERGGRIRALPVAFPRPTGQLLSILGGCGVYSRSPDKIR